MGNSLRQIAPSTTLSFPIILAGVYVDQFLPTKFPTNHVLPTYGTHPLQLQKASQLSPCNVIFNARLSQDIFNLVPPPETVFKDWPVKFLKDIDLHFIGIMLILLNN